MRPVTPVVLALAAALGGCASVEVGFVAAQRIDLMGVHGNLGVARCPQEPESRGGGALRRADVEREGCRTRLYSGPLEVHPLMADGSSGPTVQRISVFDGAYSIAFAELQRRSDAAVFVLGEDAWAGAVRMPVEQRRRAHALAIQRGRGSPGLLAAVRHHALPAAEAWALATEARLARQERDYVRVGAGGLSPARFLRRHPWSPFRESVLGMAERKVRAPELPCPTCPG